MSGVLPERIIVCHLGSGSSITAIKDGKSIDTSMGFSPLEGVPMSTRVGDIDPGASIHLAESLKLNLEELDRYFYKQSGLFGISGESGDMRELLALGFEGNVRAKLALDTFVYRIQKYIGSYVAALGGLDLLVFSATIGERSFIIRERVCCNLDALGIVLDVGKNSDIVSRDAFVHKEGSRAKIAVVVTDEMGEIARQTAGIIH
jgi:acetate kinase